jgi:hypothetical protein
LGAHAVRRAGKGSIMVSHSASCAARPQPGKPIQTRLYGPQDGKMGFSAYRLSPP